MKSIRRTSTSGIIVIGLSVMSFLLSGCEAGSTAAPAQPATASTPAATLSPQDTSAKDFTITDFDAVHSQASEDPNKYLIFGNIPVSPAAPDLPPELAAFLGRWEWYSYSPPVKKDWKGVLVISEITARDGKAFIWMSTNIQYPAMMQEIHFRVIQGPEPTIEYEGPCTSGPRCPISMTYDREKDTLQIGDSTVGKQEQAFYIYKDYAKYLESKRIYSREYQLDVCRLYGGKYLVYLPEGYEDSPEKTWPLMIFLHGSGDRGDNEFLLAKASPFMMIREKGPLPFIIVAPLLKKSQDYASFPDSYMDGVLEEALADYRVDQKRIYVTGLSMGGEATYRFALNHPDTFAAIAPLSAYNDSPLPMERIKDLPVWAIQGENDTVVPVSAAQEAVDALKQAGGNVQFSILKDHDHDVWTDTYSDPKFYDWLLENVRP